MRLTDFRNARGGRRGYFLRGTFLVVGSSKRMQQKIGVIAHRITLSSNCVFEIESDCSETRLAWIASKVATIATTTEMVVRMKLKSKRRRSFFSFFFKLR